MAVRAPAPRPSLLDLGLDEVEPLIVDRIFEARPGAYGTVPIIALNAHDRIGAGDQPALRDEADDIGEARIGVGLIVGAAHSTADRDVKSLDAGISGMAMKPKSWVYTSMSFDGGTTKPILNFLGKYWRP